MLAGVGTILTTDQADDALAAGAAFGVSPGINPDVVRHCIDIGLPFGPGVMTPTDIDQSVALGCRLLKFFPATSSGGQAHLKNIAAPYAHLGLGFVPLGGVSAENLGEWLANPLVAAVGGSWLAPRDLIAAGNWTEIERRARKAKQIASATG
jgi:2-dehydro-3-deoxyphosphogluconate aldolase/(4S)-4-hydroxy-2-oxoglutarate aldolase